MFSRDQLVVFLVSIFALPLLRCGNGDVSDKESVAKEYCGNTCHSFPAPSLLSKATWNNSILPIMGKKLGVRYAGGLSYVEGITTVNDQNQVVHQQPIITKEDWNKIVGFYLAAAPAQPTKQPRKPVQRETDLFKVKEVFLKEGLPATTYVKIDPGNQWIYTANTVDSSLSIYRWPSGESKTLNVHSTIVDAAFTEDLHRPGNRNGLFTNIGILNPNDRNAGTAYTFSITASGDTVYQAEQFKGLPRPVQITACDLDQDGKQDYLVCGFGNLTGALFWMKNKGDGTYQKEIIRAFPGAIKAYVNDFNKDGRPDILALFAQAREGIFLFTNNGNGTFRTSELLNFPPVYGSSYFEPADINADGYTDLVYTCGDNSDFSSNELKSYHGIYLFINNGNFSFTQKYFFPMYNCYKAVVRDFDKDGDLDIASISYYPHGAGQQNETFVYLENTGGYHFKPFLIKNLRAGRWLTMDVADVDGDGDEDIVLGNFYLPQKTGALTPAELKVPQPTFILLTNQTITK